MKRPTVVTLLLAGALLIPLMAAAAPIRAYVAQFAVTPPEAAGLKSTLQTLLSTRIASEAITPVASASEADVVITGSYTQFGKVFSLDAVANIGAGSTTALYEQGQSQDDLIPALGRLSARLKDEIVQRHKASAAPPAAAPQTMPAPVQAPALPAAPAVPAERVVHPPAKPAAAWLSQRLPGPQIAVAPGALRPEGREIFVADYRSLRLYRQEKNLKLLGEVEFLPRQKVIAIDSTGPDKDGNPRVFVTIIEGDLPASRIYSFQEGKLKEVASALPYLFRAIAFNGQQSRMYAQQMGATEDFYGDLYEVVETDGKIELKNPVKLPRYGNIFNYNQITTAEGATYSTVLSSSGYLTVYTDSGEEIWRSSEKYGGSETFFTRETGNGVRDPDDKIKWRFLDQRITVSGNGDIMVPQNAGFFVLGNSRSYSKNSMVGFTWNGSSLEERWRTKQSQNYLADYFYDPAAKELVLLEVVQKEGVLSKGGSAVKIVKAD